MFLDNLFNNKIMNAALKEKLDVEDILDDEPDNISDDDIFDFDDKHLCKNKSKDFEIYKVYESKNPDMKNILPESIRINFPDTSSLEFFDECKEAANRCNIAKTSLEKLMLTCMIAVVATYDTPELRTMYSVYLLVRKINNMAVNHENASGPFCSLRFCEPELDQYLKNIQTAVSHCSVPRQKNALIELEVNLLPFSFARVYCGMCDDMKPLFLDKKYIDVEKDVEEDKKNENTPLPFDCSEIGRKNSETSVKETIEEIENTLEYGEESAEKTSGIKNIHETARRACEDIKRNYFNACRVTYNNGLYSFRPIIDDNTFSDSESVDISSPKNIMEYLNRYVLGQKKAKKTAATAYYLHVQKNMRQNMIFVGPSGCGKTEIFRQLSKLEPHRVYIYDAASISNDGWKGVKKYYSVFIQMAAEGWSIEEIENSIIILDESDKMFSPKYSSGGDNVAMSVQSEFLAMIEGTTISVKNEYGDLITVKTENISFMFLGAFTELRKEKTKNSGQGIGFNSCLTEPEEITLEDLIEFGLCTELAGRISRIVTLDALTEDDFYTILIDPVMSPVTQFAIKYGDIVRIDRQYLQELAKHAIENDMGVRFMHGRVMDVFSDEVYSPGSSGCAHIGRNSVQMPDV